MSPITNPTRPEINSQVQVWASASEGKAKPLVKEVVMATNTKAITILIKFTAKEPTFFPASSKAIAVIVKQMAVIKAASSPKCDNILLIPFLVQSTIMFDRIFICAIVKPAGPAS